MATRYWVGGTASWSGSTANWSASAALVFTASCSGTALTTTGSPALVVGMRVWSNTHVTLGTIVSGSGNSWVVSTGGTYTSQTMSAATTGASVPSSADDVVFNSSSGTSSYTVTLTSPTCRNATIAAPTSGTLTLAGSAQWNIYGGLSTTSTGVARTYTGTIFFRATTTGNTITTGGLSFASSSITFAGVGGGWTLGSALTAGAIVTVGAGSFDTAGFALSCGYLSSTTAYSAAHTISLGASTVTLTNNLCVQFTAPALLTFNCGTSTINCTGTILGFQGGGFVFNAVSFGAARNTTSTVSGVNTFASLTITSPATNGLRYVAFANNQTIGTLTASGATVVRRIVLQSNTLATARTLTITTAATVADCDIQDIAVTGAAAPISGTRLGNCKGNSGITFDAAKTVYWNLSGAQTWDSTAWATTSGGSPSINNFPLAQDTAVFNNAGSATSISSASRWAVGTFNASARTLALSTSGFFLDVYGDFSFGTGMSSFGVVLYFSGRTTQTITTNGVDIFDSNITMNTYGGTVVLNGDMSASYDTSVITTTAGTFNANGYNVTIGGISDFNFYTPTVARGINFGSGTWTLTGNDTGTPPFYASFPTGFTPTPGTAVIYCTAALTKTFAGNGFTWPKLVNAGAGMLIITGSNTFPSLANSVVPASFEFEAGSTQTVTTFEVAGTSGNLVTLASDTPGTPFILSKSSGIVYRNYLNITDSTATGGASWYAGTTSVNGGGNTGWLFVAPRTNSNFLLFF